MYKHVFHVSSRPLQLSSLGLCALAELPIRVREFSQGHLECRSALSTSADIVQAHTTWYSNRYLQRSCSSSLLLHGCNSTCLLLSLFWTGMGSVICRTFWLSACWCMPL